MEYIELINALSDEIQYAEENFIPIIRKESAKYLYDFVRQRGFSNVLEVGTAIGFSGSIILAAGAKRLTTIDINEKSLVVAKTTFEKLGYIGNVTIYHNDAKVVLQNLVNDII